MPVNSLNCANACYYKPAQKKDNSVSKGFVIGATAPVATLAAGAGAAKVGHMINKPKSRLFAMKTNQQMNKLAQNLDKFGEISQEKVLNAGKKSINFLTDKTKGSKVCSAAMSKIEKAGKFVADYLKKNPKVGKIGFPVLAAGIVGATIGLIAKAFKSNN